MRKYLEERVITRLVDVDNRRAVVLGVGFATFFFGFFAGALLNIYLIFINSPFIVQFRSTLTYKSAIIGDGILLPAINMLIMVFLLRNTKYIKKRLIQIALFSGVCITAYFHITQAMGGIVNWTMPKPWHWNALGLWHAVYMYSVTSFLSLFYFVLFKAIKNQKYVPKEAVLVTIGLAIFLVLLRLDYIAIEMKTLIPHF